MYDTITFEQFVTYYSKLYIQEYGDDKIQKIAAKVKSSKTLNRLIYDLSLLRKPCTIDQIVYTINRVFFFIFLSNKAQAVGSLFTLCQWQDRVNLKFKILEDDDIKEIAVGIVEKLGASYPDMEFQFIKFKMIDHGMETITNPNWYKTKMFYLDDPINKDEYKKIIGNVTYKEFNTMNSIEVYNDFEGLGRKLLLEHEATLSSYFDKLNNCMNRQIVEFINIGDAKILFGAIANENDWEDFECINPNTLKSKASKDGMKKLELIRDTDYDGNVMFLVQLHYLRSQINAKANNKNPLAHFFNWLSSKEFQTECNDLAYRILKYMPGSTQGIEEESLDCRIDLINTFKKEVSPPKLIGMCMFLYTYIDRQMIRIVDNPIFNTDIAPEDHQKLISFRKSWETLVERDFNLDNFDEYMFWLMEEDYLGEENTRVKNMWN